jgi:hypothetical protein
MDLSGLRCRYLIGADVPGVNSDDGQVGAFTVKSYDATKPPTKGVGGKYVNLFDEKNSRHYGPYLHSSDTAHQYDEGQCDPKGPGFWRNFTDQLNRAKAEGFTILGDVDNRDAYHNDVVLKVYDQAHAAGLWVICKNPGTSDLDEDSTPLLRHPAVVGAIIEMDREFVAHNIEHMRAAAGRPDLPVWFVGFSDSGLGRAQRIAAEIKAKHYINIGVTYSSSSEEYGSSKDILVPLQSSERRRP